MINRSRLVSLFEKLVATDSPSFREREMCDTVSGILKSLGVPPAEDDCAKKTGGNCGNLYAFIDGSLDLPPVLFSAHMDTVEPSHGKKMILSENGVITSDKTTVLGADDCAGLAAILEALTVLKESGAEHRPFEILFTASEETYCSGMKAFDVSRLKSKEAYVFDLSGPVGSAAYSAPTIIGFKAVFSGRAAHAGFAPEDGIHAVKAAACAIAGISCGKVGVSTVNIGSVHGGTADNIIPDRCVVTGEIRSLSDVDARIQLENVFHIMQSEADILGASVELQSTVSCTAYSTPTDHEVSMRFKSACKKLDLPLKLCETFGGSDNNCLAQHGIKGLVVATAMNNCHSTDEYTTVSELENAANLALELMLSKE